MTRQKLTSIDAIIDKLIDTSKIIQNRMGLKPAEEIRVTEAFKLLAAGELPPDSKARANRKVYINLLKRIELVFGLNGVVLCAVGLGVSAVASMKDRIRVDIPVKMKEREVDLAQDGVQSIANAYSAKYLPTKPIAALPNQVGDARDDGIELQMNQMDPAGGATATPPYTGDAYELTWADVQMIAGSNQIVGKTYLVDTYAEEVNSFVIIPISPQLTNHFAMQRRKL